MKSQLLLFLCLLSTSLYSQTCGLCSIEYTDTLKKAADTIWVGHLYKTFLDCKIVENGLQELELIYQNKTIIMYEAAEGYIKGGYLNDSLINQLSHNYSAYTKYSYYPSGQLKTEYKSSMWFEDIKTFYYNKSNKKHQVKKVAYENLFGREGKTSYIKMNYKYYPYFIIGKAHYKGHPFRKTTLYFKEGKFGLETLRNE